MPYVSKLFSAPTGAIFRGANNQIINTITSYIHLVGEFTKEKKQ